MSARSAVILIVEDNGTDVFLLRRALANAGVPYPVRVAHDGQEAVDYLSGAGKFQDREQYPVPCLVVLDTHLPRKNGLEVLRWFRGREVFRDLPVVMMASAERKSEREEAAGNGVEEFLVKPVDFDELVNLARIIGTEAEDHCKDARPCPSENDLET